MIVCEHAMNSLVNLLKCGNVKRMKHLVWHDGTSKSSRPITICDRTAESTIIGDRELMVGTRRD